MSIYILLHGAWHARWCWKYVTPLLEEKGHTVYTPDLPGHGHDLTPFAEITLKTYVDSVIELINRQEQPVVLVGHSMAGIIISQVAEQIPEKIDQLIYVAAFIPENHQSLSQCAQESKSPGLAPEIIIDEAKNSIALIKSNRLKTLFYNCCNEKDVQEALALLQPEPFFPFITPISITPERFGKVRKHYIECLQDGVLLPEDQKRMYSQTNSHVVSLNVGHSPFFSMPEELVKALD